MVPRFMTLSLFFAESENWVPSGRMYPRRLGMPLSESRELIDRPEADDLDGALAIAARCPGAWDGAVEVRPVLPMGG